MFFKEKSLFTVWIIRHKYNVRAEGTIFVLLKQTVVTTGLQKVHMLMPWRMSVICFHRTLVLQSQSALYSPLSVGSLPGFNEFTSAFIKHFDKVSHSQTTN